MYVGSANLTQKAWYNNIEAGCFFEEHEITDEMASDILSMFSTLENNSTPLTKELLEVMRWRATVLAKAKPDAKEFWESPGFKRWPGLGRTSPKKAKDLKRQIFLGEWHATLQDLRDIGSIVSRPENRPTWVTSIAPAGAQADQFLHAHYYQRTFDGRRANYASFYETNKSNRSKALQEAMTWWRQLPKAPTNEDEMLTVTAPFLRSALSFESLTSMNEAEFQKFCMGIHAIKDYARRVPNKSVSLPDNGTSYTIPQKVTALSKRIWADRSANGSTVTDLIKHVLYGGTNEYLPERLWQAVTDPQWSIAGLGISAFGELVGWALPDQFPPRNGRTSKALKSLGFDVTVHVE